MIHHNKMPLLATDEISKASALRMENDAAENSILFTF
jgi:hypothetical protein